MASFCICGRKTFNHNMHHNIDWPVDEILVLIAFTSGLGILECINLNIYAADVISRHHLQSKRYLKDKDQNNRACFIYCKCKHVTKYRHNWVIKGLQKQTIRLLMHFHLHNLIIEQARVLKVLSHTVSV